MDIQGEEDKSYNAKADVMRGRGARHLLALMTKGEGGLRQMLILADSRGRGVILYYLHMRTAPNP